MSCCDGLCELLGCQTFSETWLWLGPGRVVQAHASEPQESTLLDIPHCRNCYVQDRLELLNLPEVLVKLDQAGVVVLFLLFLFCFEVAQDCSDSIMVVDLLSVK